MRKGQQNFWGLFWDPRRERIEQGVRVHTTDWCQVYHSEVKVIATDPDDLSWTPRTQWERTNSPKLYCHLHMHIHTCKSLIWFIHSHTRPAFWVASKKQGDTGSRFWGTHSLKAAWNPPPHYKEGV